MIDVLQKIMATKVEEVDAGKQHRSVADLTVINNEVADTRGFIKAIQNKINVGHPAVIAEVKKASPSKGIIRPDFDPEAIALSYQLGGAACLSVLTDQQYFKGHDEYLKTARAAVDLPVLRKDFMVDEWQIHESRSLGADCVLLIVACLDDAQLQGFYQLATELGMDALIEVHDEGELERALKLPAQLIGVNNRNLKTFETSLSTSQRLKQLMPDDRIVVSESGIHEKSHIHFLQAQGINTFLIGESMMRHPEPGEHLSKLIG